jgi:SAM-dependent methyltransferase
MMSSRSDVSSDSDIVRQPHAVLDLPSREKKAIKIARLLALEKREGPIRMLEIGTGSGGIAAYFAGQAGGRFTVDAVDVIDNRVGNTPYRFSLVGGTALPFPDEAFDVVITNHVIEHVGDAAAQLEHLREVHRVLGSGGVAYLAVPNRWQLVEPHYRLAFLSWLPRAWRSRYLRMSGRGTFYDCEPLTVRELEDLLDRAGFVHENVCVPALYLTIDLEGDAYRSVRFLRHVPRAVFERMRALIPTLTYVLRRK